MTPSLREALRALVQSIETVTADPSFLGVFQIAAVHGYTYQGPVFKDALDRARAALAAPDEGRRAGFREGVDAAERLVREEGRRNQEQGHASRARRWNAVAHQIHGLVPAAPASPEPRPETWRKRLLAAQGERDARIDEARFLRRQNERLTRRLLPRAASPEPRPDGWPSVMVNGGMAAPLKANCRCGEGVAGYTIRDVAHVSTGACIELTPPASPDPEPARCNAEHPIFTYTCFLPPGHAGPHDNGSGDPWETP